MEKSLLTLEKKAERHANLKVKREILKKKSVDNQRHMNLGIERQILDLHKRGKDLCTISLRMQIPISNIQAVINNNTEKTK